MKRGGGSRKGSAFERHLCAQLSLWWTDGANDAVFWRTSGSGARATARGKRGRKTANACGDVSALDPIGQPFIDLFAVEVKKGYSRHTIADLLDKPAKAKSQLYEKWINQAERSRIVAGASYWLLIVQRDRREALVFLSARALADLPSYEGPYSMFDFGEAECIYCLRLADFLKHVKPEHLRRLAEKLKEKKNDRINS